jgi:SAM-dependent methyltransferase
MKRQTGTSNGPFNAAPAARARTHGFDARRRVRVNEWMDQPHADPGEIQRSLRFIRRINWLLGYTRTTIRHLERFSRDWQPGQRIDLIDFATGSADIPRAILKWARRRGFNVHIVGVDLHWRTAREAARQTPAGEGCLHIVQADVLRLPFEPASFDYALTAMFLHHLDDEAAVAVLAAMNCVARRGVVVADLIRDRRAYRWIKLFSRFATPMVRHDGPASVAQAFTRQEVLNLRDRAGLHYAEYHSHFGHRFVLSGRKGTLPAEKEGQATSDNSEAA